MLNFKIGKTYKDFLGKEWEFCSYCSIENYPYRFKDKYGDIKSFKEYTDTVVTEWDDGTGIRIPFVEEQEKEREWVVGEKYECYNVYEQRFSEVTLLDLITKSKLTQYLFKMEGKGFCVYGVRGEIIIFNEIVIFKNGIPEELRKRLEKGEDKITNKQKCFQKEQVYKSTSGREFIFKKRVKTKDGLFAIFENKEGWLYFDKLYKVNNIECILLCSFKGTYLCADESIRNEDTSKAVRVKE